MKHYYLHLFKIILVFFFFYAFDSSSYAQEVSAYKNGVHTGVVKVKFTPQMTPTLQTMKVTTRSNQLSTGILSFDAVAKNVQATNMERLFPEDPDPKFENKLRKHGLHLWYIIYIPGNENPVEVARKFNTLDIVDIASVEHEKVLPPTTFKVQDLSQLRGTKSDDMPFDDPQLKFQWHYNNTMWENGCDINLFEAWKITAGRPDILISVHDEGFDIGHEDLKANMWINEAELNGQEGVDDDGNGYIDDICGWNFDKMEGVIDVADHGTHVSGTIAAVNNNKKGVSGIAGGTGKGDGVKILPLQILGGKPGSIVRSYQYAVRMGAVISQNSWGYKYETIFDPDVDDAIDYFIAEAGDYEGSPMKGGIVIFAAGNDNSNGDWHPNRHPNVMAVAALAPDWKKSWYSNFGNWVEIAAPGGDTNYGAAGGVLSTLAYNRYGYDQGTSMACPHVSGIAALALANSPTQISNQSLWNKLMTGVVPINQHNPNYVDSLGVGAIDAYLAIKRNDGLPPNNITDLKANRLTQESAEIQWSVPADEDDGQPMYFDVYYSLNPLSESNLNTAKKITLKNELEAGASFIYEIEGLNSLTKYYFAIKSLDRWDNASGLSNILEATTNNGPKVNVDDNSKRISLSINTASSATASHNIIMLNEDEGTLKWNYFTRNNGHTITRATSGIKYPTVPAGVDRTYKPGMSTAKNYDVVRAETTTMAAYQTKQVNYMYGYATNYMGDVDIRLPNSAAVKFVVDDEDGFNLTGINFWLDTISVRSRPIVLEIYEGIDLKKAELITAEEYIPIHTSQGPVNMTLGEHLFFPKGSTFWAVLHIPAHTLYPLGMGFEANPVYSTYCYMSNDLGDTWMTMQEAIGSSDYTWSIAFLSNSAPVDKFMTLNPVSGSVDGNSQSTVVLTADGSALINGNYKANMVIKSNDSKNPEFRIPVEVAVAGQVPKMSYPRVIDFGNVFQGSEKTLRIAVENIGFGANNNLTTSIDNPQFTVVSGNSYSIAAKGEAFIDVSFKPTGVGSINGILKLKNDSYSYDIMINGVGAATTEMTFTPEEQDLSVTNGQPVTANVTVSNTGQYPLTYYIPGYDTEGISGDLPSKFHKYGYKLKTSADVDPLAYEFYDISSTGTDITRFYDISTNWYYPVYMGFSFPFYKNVMDTVFIAQGGFATFDSSVNPINAPSMKNSYQPKGFISLLGTNIRYSQHSPGKILVQNFEDRVIVQWDNVWNGYYADEVSTAQMVLFPTGDIRFYYKKIQEIQYGPYNILIEDMDKTDGILIYNYENSTFKLSDSFAIGLDYPGPDIISDIKNGSGVIPPGGSSEMEITLNPKSLNDGLTKRYVNVISNDPVAQKYILLNLNVTGGTPEMLVSTDKMEFDAFTGTNVSRTFTVRNAGKGLLNVDMSFENNSFEILETLPVSINPNMTKTFTVKVPTSESKEFNDKLFITDGNITETITLSATVIPPPAIDLNNDKIIETLNVGEKTEKNISIKNTGESSLFFTPSAEEWMYFEAEEGKVPVGYGYESMKYTDGTSYNWIDIASEENKLPEYDYSSNPAKYWRTVKLGFDFEFYGVKYDSIKIADNGIISIGGNPAIMQFTGGLFPPEYDGGFIMPAWGSLFSFDTYNYPGLAGLYCKEFDDKLLISWEILINAHNQGNRISIQTALHKNGNIKILYKIIPDSGGIAGETTTKEAKIALIKPDKSEYLMISDNQPLTHGKGLAIVIPALKKYEIAVNETLNGKLVLDATNMLGGVYTKPERMYTNVPEKELIEREVELTVNGEVGLTVLDAVEMGNHEILAKGDNAHLQQFVIGNEGTQSTTITKISLENVDQYLDAQIYATIPGFFPGMYNQAWISVQRAFTDPTVILPTMEIRPGEEIILKIQFKPVVPGSFSNKLFIETNTGDSRSVTLTGSSYNPPAISVDQTPIVETFNDFTETAEHTIKFDNKEGETPLVYDVHVEYHREGEVSGLPKAIRLSDNEVTLQNAGLTPKGQSIPAVRAAANEYNKVIQFGENVDDFIGVNPQFQFTFGTRFNAGSEGFNVSNVGLYFRSERINTGMIEVDVRVGSNITDAVVVATGVLLYENENTNDLEGKMYDIPLNESVAIYPNEDFYVVYRVPAGISNSIGTDMEVEQSAFRYFFSSSDVWYDLQKVTGFDASTSGFITYAAEKTPEAMDWLEVINNGGGNLPIGESSEAKIKISGTNALRGNQFANIVFRSNDTNNPAVRVPVTLHMNEAPIFVDAPADMFMGENATESVNINIMDVEGHSFNVEAIETDGLLTHSFEDNVLSLTFTTKYGDAGIHNYVFRATDALGATSDMTIRLEVRRSNRAPVYIGSEKLIFVAQATVIDYSINSLFEDPDGDPMTFTMTCEDESVINIFKNDFGFAVKPVRNGSTKLIVTVKDNFGATTIQEIGVEVSGLTSIDSEGFSGVQVYPNPVKDNLNIRLQDSWTGENVVVELVDVTGKTCLTREYDLGSVSEIKINISDLPTGVYQLLINKQAQAKVIKE